MMQRGCQIKLCKLFVLTSILSIISLSCNQQKTKWQGTVDVVDGVTVVKNPIEPMYEEEIFRFTEELTIGESEGREEHLFENLWFIVVDDRERIFISEGAGSRAHIKVFDNLGDYLMAIGRKGEGPGEFGQVSWIQITPENELMIFDRLPTKLTFFSLDGDYLRTNLMRGKMTLSLMLTSQGNFVFYKPDFKSENVSGSFNVANVVEEYSSDFEFIKTIAKDKYRSSTLFQSWMMARFFPPDRVICGHSEVYEICFYSSEGVVEKRISKDFIPMAISDSEKERRGIIKKNKHLFVFHFDSHREIETQFSVDVFSNGVYQNSYNVEIGGFPHFMDREGFIYCTENTENGYAIIKYAFKFSGN